MPDSLRIEVCGLEKSYGEEHVLKDLNLTLSSGNFYCLMAPSGTGKTTLLRILMGLETPDRGTIASFGISSPRIAAVFQEDRLLEGYTALQNLKFVTGKRYSQKELTNFILTLLPEDSLEKPVYEFSGGMRRRVAILRSILAPSDMVLMDEPFTGLDHETKLSAIGMIRSQCSGKLLIAATHAGEDAGLLGAQVVYL